MRPAAAFLFAVTLAHGANAPPVLAIVIDHAISRPGRNGRGIERPLFLLVSDYQTQAPQVEAPSFSGAITAHCTRLASQGREWNAEVHYQAQQENEAAFNGAVTLHLTIDGTIVRGTYRGVFHDTPYEGRAGAGLAFEHDFTPEAGLLLWIPRFDHKLRGIIICGNGGELEKREAALVEETQAFAAAHDLALIGTAGLNRAAVTSGAGARIFQGLSALAGQTAHPELETAPIFFMGHSGGGGMSAGFNRALPARTGAYISSHGGAPPELSPSALGNPAIFTAGEMDPKVSPLGIESNFLRLRLAGARASLLVEQNEHHPMGPGAMPLFLYFFERVLTQRLPPGAPALNSLDDSKAWVADNASWRSGITRIMPASETGESAHPTIPPEGLHLIEKNGHIDFTALPLTLRLSWLPDKDAAYVYRGAATYDNPLKLTRGAGHQAAYSSDETVTLQCEDFGPGNWRSVAVYDGATLLGTVTPAKPQLTLPRQRAGAHAGVLIGERPNGDLRTSLPVLWSVWPPF